MDYAGSNPDRTKYTKKQADNLWLSALNGRGVHNGFIKYIDFIGGYTHFQSTHSTNIQFLCKI